MKGKVITVRNSIFIDSPREVVFDFTQDYSKRTLWDKRVIHVEVIPSVPQRMYRLQLSGNTKVTFKYKLDDRPNKTSLSAIEFESPVFESGGGSWTYEDLDGGTLWTQVNTLVMKEKWLFSLIAPVVRWMMKRQTKHAMEQVKRRLENFGERQ